MIGWHWVGDKLRDGSPVPADGEWLEYKGKVVMCQSGLHFSECPLDALNYAPGPILCRVEVADVVDRQSDKAVCRRRKIIERHDMTDDLRLFARQCALDVIHLWDAPDVVRRYLETGDESLRAAAEAAARDAAWDTARDAAWDAAEAAAWDAAWAAQKQRFSDLVNARFGL